MNNKGIKICLPLRGSLAGRAIAYLLKENYGVKEFYDFDCLKKDEEFFNSQKDIEYTPLFVSEELRDKVRKEKLDLDYIKFLEKEYGLPTLWPYITVDRRFIGNFPKSEYAEGGPACSHEEMLKHLQVKFREIIKALEEKKPDCVIFVVAGKMETQILYQVAKKMSIPTFNIEHTRVKYRATLADNCYNVFSGINRVFDAIRRGEHQSFFKDEAIAYLKEFREKPSSSIHFAPAEGRFVFGKLARALRYFWQLKKESPDYIRKHLIRSRRKLQGFKGLFEEPKDSEDFAFYPLHSEPELALSLLAPFFTHQIALIQNIARSLPVHFKLYIKEHPGMIYYRPLSYYKELKKIPNIRLINPKISSASLIKKTKLVLTLTSTAGWEAALLKKPAITFGSAFFNKVSMVKNCKTLEELPRIIKECLESQHDEEELIDFLSAIFEDSVLFEHVYAWQGGKFTEMIKSEDFKNLVDFLAQKLNLTPVS